MLDYKQWVAMDNWNAAQAACLLMGKNPESCIVGYKEYYNHNINDTKVEALYKIINTWVDNKPIKESGIFPRETPYLYIEKTLITGIVDIPKKLWEMIKIKFLNEYTIRKKHLSSKYPKLSEVCIVDKIENTLSETFFKTLNDHEKNTKDDSQNFLKFISNENVPATLAVFNEETKKYLYISKGDLENIIKTGEISTHDLYRDINCTQVLNPSEIPIRVSLKELIITIRAHRRLLAFSTFGNTLNSTPILENLMLTEQKLRHYFLKDKWKPLEAAHIICGIDPAPLLNLNPIESHSYGFNQAFNYGMIEITNQIKTGYYDETQEEHIITWHAQDMGNKISFAYTAHKIWQAYDVISTWEEKEPLAILNKLFSTKFIPIDISTFRQCDHMLIKLINEIKDSKDSRYKKEYIYLDEFLNKYNLFQKNEEANNNHLLINDTKERNTIWQEEANKIWQKEPRKKKIHVAEDIASDINLNPENKKSTTINRIIRKK